LELEDAESYVPGEPTRLPVDIAKSAMKQMIQGLAYLHGKGITHGDLQPGNVLITVDHAEQGLRPSRPEENNSTVTGANVHGREAGRDGKRRS